MDFFLFSMFLMVFLSMIGFCLLRKHVLLTLLSLEGCNLGLCMIVFFYFTFCFSEFYLFLLFIIFVVCEGVLGLCLLVSFMRSKGSDYAYGLEFLC